MANATYAERPRSILKIFDTRDVEAARQALATIYSASASVEPLERNTPFLMRMRAAALGRVTVASVDIANWRMTRESADSVVLTFPRGPGPLQVRTGSVETIHVANRHVAVARPAETYSLATVRGHGLALTIPAAALVARAERLTGEVQRAALLSQVRHQVDLNAPVARTLARALKAAIVELEDLDTVGMGALASANYEDLLLNLAAATIFPGIAELIGRAAPDCGPAAVRRARDHIQEHAARPIELARLAADLGVSMRALQENFRRCYGMSPRDYIQQCRLEQAHDRLNAAGAGSSVTDIAFACGFGDLSQFSAKYRERYGEPPSDALRAARSRAPLVGRALA